jgi:hypothetical protein
MSVNHLLYWEFRMKYVRALEYVLQNAPIRAKDADKKVSSIILKTWFFSD